MKPLQRSSGLVPLSRDHHASLQLCWKIRSGLSRSVDPERIMKYCAWFYRNQLLPHFGLEETRLFPILGSENELVRRALADHRRLSILFHIKGELKVALMLIEEELESHIRFEERILFSAIQETASPEELKMVGEFHVDHACVNDSHWIDPFWI